MLVRLLTKPNNHKNNNKKSSFLNNCLFVVFVFLSLFFFFLFHLLLLTHLFFFLSFTVPVRPRRMIRETYTFDTVATSNTISNGELTAYRIIKLHRYMKFKVAFFSHLFFFLFVSFHFYENVQSLVFRMGSKFKNPR